VDTAQASVPPGPEPWADPADARPPRPPRRGWIVAAFVAGLIGLLAVGGIFVTLPYVAISPGGADQIADLIRIQNGPSYVPKGRILLTTVSVSVNGVNAYEALQGWLDPETDVLPRKDVFGPVDRKTYRQQNVADMTDSKQIAAYVAEQRLGYPTAVHGDGAVVASVQPGMPGAGVLEPGQVVTAADGKPIALKEDLVAAIQAHRPGETVRLDVVAAAGQPAKSVDVKLAARQDGSPILGVTLQTRNQRFDVPVKVNIDSGNIGGPSAGLAFTLSVLDILTPGELTGGMNVAATGTIEPDGRVGPVGGVAQKTAAVRRSGAKLFLVPSDEFAEATAHAGKDLKVVKVDSVDDALRALSSLKGSNALALGTPGRAA
jgi:PDZ domain-containing protein